MCTEQCTSCLDGLSACVSDHPFLLPQPGCSSWCIINFTQQGASAFALSHLLDKTDSRLFKWFERVACFFWNFCADGGKKKHKCLPPRPSERKRMQKKTG